MSQRRTRPQKHQSPEFAEVLFIAERAILDCFIKTERALTDKDLLWSLEHLILELRGEKPSRLPNAHFLVEPDGTKVDLVSWAIKLGWDDYFVTQPRLGLHHLCGVLRTIMQSIERFSVGDARGYLRFLEDLRTPRRVAG